jgi:hypothetical protein
VILRILRGRARRDDLAPLMAAVRTDIAEWAAIDDSLVSAEPAWRPAGNGVEFLLVSTWSDAESVMSRGGDVSLPRGRVGESGLLEGARAQHFELMMGASRRGPRAGELVRLSTISLVPRRSSAFYEEVRRLWDELVADAAVTAVHVGRRAAPDQEEAVVVSVWESEAALEGATPGGFVGGDGMATFYATEPVIEHFTALALDEG